MNGEWVPTFPNARYVTSRLEREFWATYDMEEVRKADVPRLNGPG